MDYKALKKCAIHFPYQALGSRGILLIGSVCDALFGGEINPFEC